MRIPTYLSLLPTFALLAIACKPAGFSAIGEAAARAPEDNGSNGQAFWGCPVTQPPDPPFVPPSPYPPQPPGEEKFWFGGNGLWTALPDSGSWRQLALGEMFWWWSEEFDVSEDATPDLEVSARRLDENAPVFLVSEATNGYHSSFHWAMLIGVRLAAPGCWEFTGHYKSHELSFVLWVPPE